MSVLFMDNDCGRPRSARGDKQARVKVFDDNDGGEVDSDVDKVRNSGLAAEKTAAAAAAALAISMSLRKKIAPPPQPQPNTFFCVCVPSFLGPPV